MIYTVNATVTMGAWIDVEADSEAEAEELAREAPASQFETDPGSVEVEFNVSPIVAELHDRWQGGSIRHQQAPVRAPSSDHAHLRTRMNIEAHEQAMDAAWRHSDASWQTCLYDSAQDARSEARYEETEADRESKDTERLRRGQGGAVSAREDTEC